MAKGVGLWCKRIGFAMQKRSFWCHKTMILSKNAISRGIQKVRNGVLGVTFFLERRFSLNFLSAEKDDICSATVPAAIRNFEF